MRQARFLALLALLLALAAPPAVEADEKAAPSKPQITLKDLHGGGRRFTKGIPNWGWRPGHIQLVRLDNRRGAKDAKGKGRNRQRVIQTMDPATGKTADLFNLSDLTKLVPGKGTRMRGVGRAGAPPFTWRKDGKALCAVVKGDLVWVDLEAGTQRRLTTTDAPMSDLNISPDGSYVSYSLGNELWVCATNEGKPYPVTKGSSATLLNGTLDWVYPEELGHKTAAWFSPDSKQIAYLQMDQSKVPRYRVPGILPLRSEGREMFYPKAGDPNPKVRVGVVPVGGGETEWVELPEKAEYVLQVSWAAHKDGGGHGTYVLTANRAQNTMWSSGSAGLMGETTTDDGWMERQLPPRWLTPYRRLGRWKPDATQWYIQDTEATVDQLDRFHVTITPEGVDASAILHIDPASGACFYAGREHGSTTQGVYVGGPGTKRAHRAPFAKDATQWTTASLDHTGTYALVTTSDAVTPTKRVLVEAKNGKLVREIGNAHTPLLDKLKLATPEYGKIPVEGMTGKISWRLWKPHDFDAQKRYGLIVHVYAGPGSNMVKNSWGRGPLMQTMLCDKGYLVLQVDGRGTGGQGADWLYSVYGKLGLLELEDQVTAVKEILKRGYVDPERVGIWGWSYGGTMACNALTMRSDVFKAGVAVASVTDWRLYDTIYTERYMGLPKDNPKGYKETSASTHAKKMTGQLLLMHGMGDDNVHAQNTFRLVEAFIRAKKLNYAVHLYPRRGHGIGGASLDVFTRLVNWFDRHIGPGR